jgi:predicted ATPase
MRRGVELLREQNVLWFDGLLKIALAEADARAGDPAGAVATLDEALATSERTGHRAFEAEIHRARGDALLMRDPANSAPAEEAFLTAIALATQQGTRSFELRAVLSLAKLYHSASRLVDAYAVLTAALEGFSATSQMLEFAEAEALLAVLAETDEVVVAIAQRKRRIHLQTTLAHAEMWSKGFAAEETATALSRAVALTSKAGEFSERLAAAHVQWTMAIARGELSMARELASAMLREAEDTGHRMETSVARRGLALIYYFSGAFLEARSQCQRALADCDPERDQEVRERFGDDIGTVVMSTLALTAWNLGEVDRARESIDEATRRATKLGHRVSEANPLSARSILELLRGDATAALSAAERLETLSREQGMAFWLAGGEMVSGWARGRLGDPVFGEAQLRRALTSYAEQGARVSARFFQGLLAEIETETLGVESALARVEEALTDADQVEYRWDLAFIHRLHGNLLLKRDPNNPAAAERAFQTAIAIAGEQGARSFRLQAALKLAKLYQSTNRLVDAQAVLPPALEGFSPTPEMPEIAEARALLVAIEAGAHVRQE